MKNYFLVLCLLPLFLLSSCKDSSLSDLAKDNQWNQVAIEAKSRIDEKGIDKETLYYYAIALYYTGQYEEAIHSARIYILMYDNSSPAILKILLYKASLEEAYEVGIKLKEEDLLNSSDKIQLFKIITSLGRESEEEEMRRELEATLSPYNYCFALLNAKSSSSNLISGLELLHENEGISTNFLYVVDKVFNLISTREDRGAIDSFIENTFDGNAQYALIIGDYYYKTNDNEKALSYWQKASSIYPNAYKTRLEFFD